MSDPRRFAPAAARNREPITETLRRVLPPRGTVLEIASGSGEHVVHFARALLDLVFQPSDLDVDNRASVDAWIAAEGLSNVRPALALDATAPEWPLAAADAVLCINMVHISPWSATLGLARGARRILSSNGVLYLYGPYRRAGVHTAPSNAAFDESLRERNPVWGVRDIEAVTEVVMREGFAAPAIEPMPANNLSVIFRRL